MTKNKDISSLTAHDWQHVTALTQWFQGAFPPSVSAQRPLWRVAEYPVVLDNGWPIEVQRVLSVLQHHADWTTHLQDDALVALSKEGVRVEIGAGVGTLRVVIGPCVDLHHMKTTHEAVVKAAALCCRQLSAHVLSYGIQPASIVHPALMTPTADSQARTEVIGIPWMAMGLMAGDQLRVSIHQEEMIPLLNLAQSCASTVIALCANSPIFRGGDGHHCSGRHQLMRMIEGDEHRQGISPHPFETPHDAVAQVALLPRLVSVDDSGAVACDKTLLDVLSQPDAVAMETAARTPMFLKHAEMFWPDARLNPADGTLSLHAACQQPWAAHMSAVALQLGMIEAGPALADYLHTSMLAPTAARVPPGVRQPPDPHRKPWDTWSQFIPHHQHAVHLGLRSPPLFTGHIEGVLRLCSDALVRRGHGEEVFLNPLWQRLQDRESPAQSIRRVFHRGGMDALIKEAAVPPA